MAIFGGEKKMRYVIDSIGLRYPLRVCGSFGYGSLGGNLGEVLLDGRVEVRSVEPAVDIELKYGRLNYGKSSVGQINGRIIKVIAIFSGFDQEYCSR